MKWMRNPLRKYSLRIQIIIAFLFVSLLTIGLLALFYTRTMRTALIGQANQSLFAAASRTATSLDDFINANLDAIRTEATIPSIVSYMSLPADQRAGSAEEVNVTDALDVLNNKDLFYISSYALLDQQGQNLIDTLESDMGQNESGRDYFREPLQNGLPYVSPVTFAQKVGGVYFYFSSPVRNKIGQIMGVLRVRYSVALLQELVSESRGLAGSNSFAILLDENYARLAHDAAPELIFKSVVPFDPVRAAKLRADDRLPNLPMAELSTNLPDFESGLNDAANQPFFAAQEHAGDHLEQVAVVALETQPWWVVYAQRQEVFLFPIERAIRTTLAWIMIVTAMVVMTAVFITRWLVDPIAHLTKVAGRIASGDLTARAHVESDNEIGRLAVAFNNMTAQLQQTLAGLEQRNQQLHREISERMRAEKALLESHLQLEETLVALRDTQTQMVQQERLAAVGQLAAGIAHDFNNIMATVILHSDLLLRMSSLSPKDQKRVMVIRQQGQRAADLTQQILDFSRKSMMRRKELDLYLFLVDLKELLARTLPENIRLSLDGKSEACIVNADPTRMQQVIMNLAINARDAMPDGGELRIGLAEIEIEDGGKRPFLEITPGKWIQITVADSGKGIPDDALPHIFEPFFTTRSPLGSGLGLSQVYGIIKQHEGHINVTTKVGTGTTFTLYLPALPSSSPKATADEPQSLPRGRGETVLVVEDNAHIRAALIDSLEMLDYHVLSAANGQEALSICQRQNHEIALVLTDLVMPEMGGKELLQSLKQTNSTIKAVILTGYPLANGGAQLRSIGAAGWLQKPVNMEQLSQVVAQALYG